MCIGIGMGGVVIWENLYYVDYGKDIVSEGMVV